MSSGDLLSIELLELKFAFELKKQISCSLQLSNKTDSYVAFKVKTTNPKKYCVRPNTRIVLPRSTCDVMVTMQAQKEAPPDMQCKDKFLLQSVKTNDGVSPKDISADMLQDLCNRDCLVQQGEAGHVVEECKLRVVYVSPPQPPSPVPEGSEEGSSPRGSFSENGNVNGPEFPQVTKGFAERPEAQDKSAELRKYILDPSHVISSDTVLLRDDLSFEVPLIQIADRKVNVLRNKQIPLVKVIWDPSTGDATWELESKMKELYSDLFVDA